jgi:hypothetical protein
MNNDQLKGTLDGLGYAFVALLAELEASGHLNGPRFRQMLDEKADHTRCNKPLKDVSEREMAEAMALANLTVVMEEVLINRRKLADGA